MAAAAAPCPGAPDEAQSGWDELRRQLALPQLLPVLGPPLMQLDALKRQPGLLSAISWGAPPRPDNTAELQGAARELTAAVNNWQAQISLDVKNLSGELLRSLSVVPQRLTAALQEELEPLKEWVVLLTIQLFFMMLVLGFTVFYYA
jgi:hypothetical protein